MAACKFAVGVIAVFCFSLYGVDGQDDIEFSHTCAVSCSDKISCWGDNRYGQLGSNNINLTENQIEMRDVKQISAGGGHTCALKNNGTVFCWGLNKHGQLGNLFNSGTQNPNPIPLNVDISNVKQISAGGGHTCALKNDGSVSCWGLNEYGQLGNSQNIETGTANPNPLDVDVLNVKQITAGYAHTCALKNNGSVSCWGWNGFGQVGDGSVVDRYLPTPVSGVSMARGSAAGGAHSCTVLSTGRVQCWGQNTQGQLGDGTTFGRTTPVMVSGITNAIEVSAGGGILSGGSHTCALLSDGSVKCWGDNRYGQLGDGTMTNSSLPVLFGSGGSGDPGGGPGGGSGGSLPALPPAR